MKVLLLDELSRLDRVSAMHLVQNLYELIVKGVIDQVVATDWDGDLYKEFEYVQVQEV
jgi:hypothetical protein